MNVPKLRFKDKDGREFPEWGQSRFGDIATFSKGKGISKADIAPNGLTPCIRYGELYNEYNETIHKIKSRTNINPFHLQLSEANDVIIPASGETQLDIARAACVLSDGVALGGDLNIIKSSVNGVFLSYYLNHQKKLDIAKLSQGNSVVHLYSSQLKLLDLIIPSKTEQTKIANFLTAIDEKITQLTQKYHFLVQYKKGVMQQIFSQKLRFKDEDGMEFPGWEEKGLGDASVCLDSFRKPLNDAERQAMKGNIPYWGANNIVDYINNFLFEETIVLLAEDGGNFNEYQTRPIANISYGKCWVNNHTHVLKGKAGISNEFLYYSLVHKDITGYVSGGTRSKLTKGEMLKIKIDIPSTPEQIKIAKLLTAIDDKITHTQTQLDAVKQYKKNLLQQLFV
ncbi:MAG: restriction endonuclease subunit S [Nitrosomonas sp.]|nr:restriction endonuclease subunit S [Nitrosomonas sp.]